MKNLISAKWLIIITILVWIVVGSFLFIPKLNFYTKIDSNIISINGCTYLIIPIERKWQVSKDAVAKIEGDERIYLPAWALMEIKPEQEIILEIEK